MYAEISALRTLNRKGCVHGAFEIIQLVSPSDTSAVLIAS